MAEGGRSATIGKLCGLTLATVLVLFALAVSLLRGLLPQLDQARDGLTQYLWDTYRLQVQVKRIDAEWQAFGPALTVDTLVLPAQDGLPLSLSIRHTEFKLDFWQSLLSAEPVVEHVAFDGVDVSLDLDALAAPSAATSADASPIENWLYPLLLEQLQRFSLREAKLQLLSQQQQFRPIYVGDLRWLNQDGRHRAEGYVYLNAQAAAPERLSLQIDLDGDGYDPASIRGQAYLLARELDVGQWASDEAQSTSELAGTARLKGVVNLQAWAEFADRRLVSALLEFSPSLLEWSAAGQQQQLRVNAGRLMAQHGDNGWLFGSEGLQLISNQQAWPELQLRFGYEDAHLQGGVNGLDLAVLSPLLPLLPGVSADAITTALAMAPAGRLSALNVDWRPGQLAASARLDGLNWQPTDGVPGIERLDGRLFFDADSLRLSLPPQQLRLDFGEAFKAPLAFEAQGIELDVDLANQRLLLPSLHLENPDLALDAALRLELADTPELALAAGVELRNVAKASFYFPRQAMGDPLADYLESALQAGRTRDAGVVWRGVLADFPYGGNDGLFQAGFVLDDAVYAFEAQWPAISALRLQALFENQRMDLAVESGMLEAVDIAGARVSIPELGEQPVLKVAATLATSGTAVTHVLQQSPLRDSVGAALDVVQIQGDIQGELDFSIPLHEDADADIRGLVHFADTPLYLAKPGLQLERVNGQLSFANDHLAATDLSARLFKQPLTFSLTGASGEQGYRVDALLAGQWDLATLPASLANPLTPFYQGAFAWQGELGLTLADDDFHIQSKVQSKLTKSALLLPSPLAKAVGRPAPLALRLSGNGSGLSLTASLAEQARLDARILPDSGIMESYRLRLADSLAAVPDAIGSGLPTDARGGMLDISLAKADLADWLPLILAFLDQPPSGVDEGFFPPLKAINASLGNLTLPGQTLTDMRLFGRPEDGLWRLSADSPDFAGDIEFFPDWRHGGLKLRAERLFLAPALAEGEIASMAPAELFGYLPPLAMDVNDFRFYGRPLGHLVLQGQPEQDRYRVQTLSLTSSAASLQGQGQWRLSPGINQTRMVVNLKADKFDALSERLDINPGIKDSPLTAEAELYWQGAPHQFELANLGGEIGFSLGKGSLSEISDKGARIFSLFSLDSLLRKLSLDFSDVFGKGMFYNSFSGTLALEHGVVKTRDTEMDAIAGNMKVRGYTDLTTQSLNYDIRFVPQLASSVPTVVLLSTSAWTMGIGAFALTKVLEPVIEVISEIRFRLTGTMGEPVLEELERKSKEIEIPESVLPRTEEASAANPSQAEPAAAEVLIDEPQNLSQADVSTMNAMSAKDAESAKSAKSADGRPQAPLPLPVAAEPQSVTSEAANNNVTDAAAAVPALGQG